MNDAGWSSWSPEASLMVTAAPSAPGNLTARFHPSAVRPELCWTAPSDLGGSGQDSVTISSYRIWMHLSTQVKMLAEVPGDSLCFEVDLPQIFSDTFLFSVTAVNQVYEGLRSNILELSRAGPPGQPGPIEIENVTGSSIFLSWSPPSKRLVDCNEAFSVCQDIQTQFEHAPAATGYELYWDEGKGSLPSTLVYAGAAPVAEILVSSLRGCYQFRVRATNSGGESYFTEIQSVANLPLTSPTGLKVDSIRGGSVTLSWNEVPPSSCVWWYELQMLNVAYGNTSLMKSGVSQIDVEDLNSLDLYQFSVRLCDAALCSSFSNVVTVVPTMEPSGPTPPSALRYENGFVTVTWSAFHGNQQSSEPLQPFVESFQLFAAGSPEGPFVHVGSVSANVAPILAFPCNETNTTNDLWPSAVFVKVVASVSSAWSTETISAESEAARIFCAPLPNAPSTPTTGLLRTGTQRDAPSLFDLTVDLSLADQTPDITAVHTGWHLELVRKTDNTILESLLLTDPTVRTHTFTDLPAAIDVTVRYAVVAFSGTGPWSPVRLVRVNLVPPKPVMQKPSSDDETVAVSWTWSPGIDNDEFLEYYLYVDWIDGHFSYTNLQQPTYSTQSPNYLVNCTDGTLGGMSRSRQRLWFRAAAVSPAGIGELSDSMFWVCGSAPDQPLAPTLVEVDTSFAMLGWTQPDLHGAALLYVKVLVGTALGPNVFGFSNSEYLYNSPDTGSLLNVTANLSQPLQFALQVISDIGESTLSPWLSFSKLALPPLPPRLSIQSSTDTQIIVEWSLDRAKERGAYHTGYYVYVSVDGTTWPDEDTGFVATWQDEFTTTYTMDCTLTALLGGEGDGTGDLES